MKCSLLNPLPYELVIKIPYELVIKIPYEFVTKTILFNVLYG